MIEKIRIYSIIALQFLTLSIIAGENRNSYNILILHSYHQGLEWTDNISKGISSVFEDNPNINLLFDFMYTKNCNVDEYNDALVELYKKKMKIIPYDVMIVSDNAAYQFVQENREEIFPDIPVLFCGVNNLDTVQLKNFSKFYGIGERADHVGTISLIEELFPDRKNILVINDNTTTGNAIRNELESDLSIFQDRLNFEFLSDFVYDSLQYDLQDLDDSYVIYLLVINRDKNGKFISYANGAKKVNSVTNVPIFGSWDFYIDRGILGGKILYGKDQGEYVAKMAKQVIEGNFDYDQRQYVYSQSRYSFNYNQLKRFNIKESRLPPSSEILHKPNWKELFLNILIVVSILLFFIIVHLQLTVRKKRKWALNLEDKIEERTKELNNANKSLSEIVQSKNKILSIIAHDLKNSVNIFLNYSLLLRRNGIRDNKEKFDRISVNLQNAANQTYGLLEDILYWGKSQFKENQSVRIADVNLEELINVIAKRNKVNINNITIETDLGQKISLQSDKDILHFIVRNILNNAIKFSPKDGYVFIKTELKEQKVKIAITDFGIGMSKETINCIQAKKIVKYDNIKEVESTSFGLPVVLEYLERINGELHIESELNKGSTFTIILPQHNKAINDPSVSE